LFLIEFFVISEKYVYLCRKLNINNMNEVQKMDKKELEDILTGAHERETPALEALMNMMTSPIPKRAGLKLSKEDTAEWAEEIKKIIDKLHKINVFINDALFVDPLKKSAEQTIFIEKAKEELKTILY